jgi:hypothetical protein
MLVPQSVNIDAAERFRSKYQRPLCTLARSGGAFETTKRTVQHPPYYLPALIKV